MVFRLPLAPLLFALVLLAPVLRANLIAWYKFDEGSGSDVYDSSGRGNDLGFLDSGQSWTQKSGAPFSGSGSSLYFNGNGVAVAQDSPYSPVQDSSTISYLRSRSGGKATIAFWANPDTSNQATAPFTFINQYSNAPQRVLQSHLLFSDGNLYFDVDNDGLSSNSYARLTVTGATAPSPVNTWTHWAFVFDSGAGASAMKAYRNGVLVGSGASAFTGNIAWSLIDRFELGGMGPNSTLATSALVRWVGALDDFAIWDEPLSATQIASIASSGVQSVFAPSIESFSAVPGNVAAGSPVTLNWSLGEGSFSSLVLNPGSVNVSSATSNRLGSVTVNPSTSTNYVLTATGPGGTVSKSVFVGVGLAEADFTISEIMADNVDSAYDEDGDTSDWIELYNPNTFAKNLADWKLTQGTATWIFPNVSVPPGGYLVVWASGKNRRNPASQLHTDFKLPATGGTVTLLRPDGATSSSLAYPGQVAGYSYGYGTGGSVSNLFTPGASGVLKYLVPTASTSAAWNTLGYDDSGWTAASGTAIGYDSDTSSSNSFLPYFTVNVQSGFLNVNPSIYTRYQFNVADKNAIAALTLKLRYEDGFVAYLNGVEVARAGFTGTPAWNSSGTNRTPESLVVLPTPPDSFSLGSTALNALQNGLNILAIQGLNAGSSSSDFLLAPALEATVNGATTVLSHLSPPTPGSLNGLAATPGPLVASVATGLVDALGAVRQPVRPGLVSGTTLADSRDQFSPSTQGANGFTHGYFAGLLDTYGSASTVTSFTTSYANGNYGNCWRGVASGAPYTSLGADFTHPNGSASTGGTQSAVRRWTSTYAGTVVIEGFAHHIANAGDGTRWQLFKNGVALVDGDLVTAGTQPITVKAALRRFAVQTTVAVGDRIDLLCDAGSAAADASDGSRGWFRVRTNPDVETAGVHDTALPVTATIVPTVSPIASATLYYRINFDAEQSLALTAGPSNTWTASIPLSPVKGGQMIRWRVAATDTGARTTTLPAYASATDSPQYEGTVALDPNLASQTLLNTIHLFAQNVAATETAGGTRASLFWKGTLYDNIAIDIHGSTAAYAKKSYDIDFNQGHRFQYGPGGATHSDINLITNWRDRGKFRNPLSYQFFRDSGQVGHHAETVRLHVNGLSQGTIDLIGELNDGLLKDFGKDSDGALYKSQNDLNQPADATTGIEKKGRKFENNNDLLNAINGALTGLTYNSTTYPSPNAALAAYLCDNFDLSSFVNFTAAMTATTSSDWGHKNYMVWRDTDESGLWAPIPWDLDLSWGHYWNGTESYFDDDILPLASDKSVVMDADPNGFFRHFWVNSATAGTMDGTLNAMRVRRSRTLFDQFWAATAVPTVEQRLDEIANRIDPPSVAESDADLDLRYYGFWNQHFATYVSRDMRNEMDRVKTSFLPGQRDRFFNNNPLVLGGPYPGPEPASPAIRFGSYDSNPAGNDQSREYLEIVNDSSDYIDLTGWTLAGGVTYTFPAGAVISPAGNGLFNGRIIVAKSAAGWRSRTVSPKTAEGRFVLFSYDGQLSNRGETVELRNRSGALVSTLSVPANPSSLQNYLRVTEINYNPAAASPAETAALPGVTAQDFEFVELSNIGPASLDLTGCYLEDAFSFTVPSGTSLASGASLVVAKRPQAFSLRYGAIPGLVVLGGYDENLSNGGERVTLREPNGENILSFTYADSWFPATDGGGKTLVVSDMQADYTAWDLGAAFWRASQQTNGTPGNPVYNSPPASLPDSYSLNEDATLSVNAPGPLGNDSDLENTGLTASLVTDVASGTLNLNPDGSFTYAPPADFNGQVTFAYLASDGIDNTAPTTVTLTVNAVNDAPNFAADPINLNATEDAAFTGQLAASDVDAGETASLVFAKVSGPAWLNVSPSGALSGTPTNSEVGLNSFTVSVSDGIAPAVTATLNLTVANTNDAPTFAANPINLNATEDAAFTGQLAASDVDAGETASLVFAKVSGPAWLNVSPSGALSGTPTNSEVGLNSFTVSVSDGIAPAVTATLNLTVANTNDAPTFAANPINLNATEDAAFTGQLAASDVDAGETASLVFAKVSGPAWLNVSPSGALSGTPTNSEVGLNSFTVSVSDGIAPAVTATLNLTVANTNDAPTFAADPINLNANEDSAFAGQLAASDVDTGETASLVFAKVSGPAWLTVSSSGALSGTPTNSEVGLNSFSVSVSDGIAPAITATLNLTVANTNDAPTFAADPINLNATEDAAFTGQLAASDVDAGETASLVFAKLSGPAWLNISPSGALSGTPTNSEVGLNSFSVSVSDGIAPAVTATLNLTVANTNDAPNFAADPINLNATEDAAFTGQLAASDVDAGETASLVFAKLSGPAWLNVSPSGALTGTPTNSEVGLNSFTVAVTDSIATVTATLNITVTASGPSFTGFTSEHFSPAEQADPAISGPDADPDKDGVSNLLEYAFATDPRFPASAGLPQPALVPVTSDRHVGLTYRRLKDATDVTYTVEFSSSPNSGFTASPATQVSLTDNGDGTETVVIRDNTPVTPASPRFVRLRVTQN